LSRNPYCYKIKNLIKKYLSNPAMKTAAELHYLQHPVGAQLLPYFAQRPHARRHAALINLPRFADLFGRHKARADEPSQKLASFQA